MQRICLVLLAAVLPLSAQWRHFGRSEMRPTASLGVGVATPVNPLAARLDSGWALAGGAGIQNGSVGVMVDFLGAGMGINHAALLRQGAQHGTQKYWALTLDPIVHINERGPADFYLTGGAGIYGQLTKLRAPAGPAGPRSHIAVAEGTLWNRRRPLIVYTQTSWRGLKASHTMSIFSCFPLAARN